MAGASDAASRRDLLVQQLLEERRLRLQRKLRENVDTASRSQDPFPASSSPSAPSRSAHPGERQKEALHPSHAALGQSFPEPVSALVQPQARGFVHREPASCPLAECSFGLQDGLQLPGPSHSGGNESPESHRVEPRTRQAQQAGSSQRPRSAPPLRQSFGNRLQEWSLRHQALVQRQQLARHEKETKEMESCTFRPTINNKSELFSRRSRGCHAEPLVDRLHHEADRRASMRTKAKEIIEADAMCSCTFRPQINRSRSADSSTPIHLRSEASRQIKLEKLKAFRHAEELRSNCSFQPQISSRSEKLVQRRRDRLQQIAAQGDAESLKLLGSVEERLYSDAQAALQRKAARQENADLQTSTPSVDEESRRICKTSVYFQGPQQDFLTRQQTFELAKQRRMEVRAQHAEIECSFRPKISDKSVQIVACNVDLLGESPEDRVQRLAVRDVERRDQIRGALEDHLYRACTFKPHLNRNSQILASRLESSEGSHVHERLFRSCPKQRLEDSKDECSFRPVMDPRSVRRFAHVKPRYSSRGSDVMQNIREELERRELQRAEKRRELEEQQRAECTFAPSTGKPYEEPTEPVVVSGLGRFFELKTLAIRKQQEQQEREAKVFRPDVGKFRCGVTIPEPFVLSKVKSPKSRDGYSPLPEGCTFTPTTSESGNRDLIRKLMGSEALAAPTARLIR